MPDPRPGAVPFQEAIDFFRAKTNLPTRAWTDLWQDQHAVAFTVAGAQSAGLLADLRAAVDAAIAGGGTVDEFRRDFDAIVARHGWAHKGAPGWRSRVIFETNVRTAYQAGRWEQMQELRAARPYARYVAVLDDRTRPAHRAWHGTILPLDHPWWRTHYPPNGWGCRCTVMSLSPRDLDKAGWKVTADPPSSDTVERIVDGPEGRERVQVPQGVDPGWAYNVGVAAQRARAARLAADGIAGMPADLGAVVAAAMPAETRRALADDFRAWVTGLPQRSSQDGARHLVSDGTWRTVGALSLRALSGLERRDIVPTSAAIGITAGRVAHAMRPSKASDGVGIGLADMLRLPELVAAPDAVLLEVATGAVLLVFTPADPDERRRGKIVVQLDMTSRTRGPTGRQRRVMNTVKTAGLLLLGSLRLSDYIVLDGAL